jgi:[citrate (pro-3S)-lyase] ligase
MSFHFVQATTESEIEKTKKLLEASHLHMDKHVSFTYNLYEDDELVGTISTHENVIKMIAVKEDRQGEQITAHLLQHIMRLFEQSDVNKYFIFTKPENKSFFSHYPFRLITETQDIALFENHLYPIEDHLLSLKLRLRPKHGTRAGIVMNCNPVTNGHLYLIERCAKEVNDVIIFLVEENRSVFPFDVRYQLLRKATKHLKNVHVLPSTPYVISLATFPTYFMKELNEASLRFMELDITLFKQHFFSMFELDYRYVGTEPFDQTTACYNETMKKILGDKLVEIDRKMFHAEVISASTVRKMMAEKKYHTIKGFVPKPTCKFLMSKEGKALFHA